MCGVQNTKGASLNGQAEIINLRIKFDRVNFQFGLNQTSQPEIQSAEIQSGSFTDPCYRFYTRLYVDVFHMDDVLLFPGRPLVVFMFNTNKT